MAVRLMFILVAVVFCKTSLRGVVVHTLPEALQHLAATAGELAGNSAEGEYAAVHYRCVRRTPWSSSHALPTVLWPGFVLTPATCTPKGCAFPEGTLQAQADR